MKKKSSRKIKSRSASRSKKNNPKIQPKKTSPKIQRQEPSTNLKKLYDALRESEDKYRRLVEMATDIIYRTNGEGKFIYVNPVSLRIFGYSEQEFIGKHYLELFLPDFRNKARQFYATQFFSGQYSSYLEFPAIDKEGKQFWLGQNVQPLMEDGQIIGFQAVARDITKQKLAEEARRRSEEDVRKLNAELEMRVSERTVQLENANKELEAFSYSVSHDLRSPLLTINGFSQFLSSHLGDKLDAEGTRILGIIRSNIQTMQNLIAGLLMLSQTSKKELQNAAVDMTNLVHETYREITTHEVQKKITFSVGPVPEAWGDRTLLRQVWSNLLSNAIKFTLEKSVRTIEVGGYSDGNRNIYFVKDSGAGFDMDNAKKLFGVFQRLHTNEEFEGTGVGLSIVRRVVHRHNGQVWAEGVTGEGATFYFSLPKG